MTDNNTISREEAQDLIQAIAAQRDAHANNEAQLSAALAKAKRDHETQLAQTTAEANRQIAELKERIAELEDQLKDAAASVTNDIPSKVYGVKTVPLTDEAA